MRIVNKTAHKTGVLRGLVNFVSQFSDFSAMATLKVGQLKSNPGTGYAWKNFPNKEDYLICPSLVQIKLGGCSFPYYSQTVDEIPGATLNTWQEEFVLILAHELHHIESYWGNPIADDQEAEYAAEMHGIKVLTAYRKSVQKVLDNQYTSAVM